MTSKTFWTEAAERALKTAAQTAIATLGAGAVDVLVVDWVSVGSLSLGAALLSVLSSVASTQVGNPDTASIVD